MAAYAAGYWVLSIAALNAMLETTNRLVSAKANKAARMAKRRNTFFVSTYSGRGSLESICRDEKPVPSGFYLNEYGFKCE